MLYAGLNETSTDLIFLDSNDLNGKSEFQNVDLGIINANSCVEKEIFIRCSVVAGNRSLTSAIHFHLSEPIDVKNEVYSVLVEKLTINFSCALEIGIELNPLPKTLMTSVIGGARDLGSFGKVLPSNTSYNKQDFMNVVVSLKNISSCPLVLEKSDLLLKSVAFF